MSLWLLFNESNVSMYSMYIYIYTRVYISVSTYDDPWGANALTIKEKTKTICQVRGKCSRRTWANALKVFPKRMLRRYLAMVKLSGFRSLLLLSMVVKLQCWDPWREWVNTRHTGDIRIGMPSTTVVWLIWLVQFWLIRSCFSQKSVSCFQVFWSNIGTEQKLGSNCFHVFSLVFSIKRTWDPSTQLMVWYIFHLGLNSDQEKLSNWSPRTKELDKRFLLGSRTSQSAAFKP